MLKYGNRVVTQLSPFVIEFEKSAQKVQIQVDGKIEEVKLGSIIKVKKGFKVLPSPLRVNVIGFTPKGRAGESEANYEITLAKLLKKYSIDIRERQYRIEFYNGKKFAGMVIVDFER